MDYIITFSDVMTIIITGAVGILTFFVKSWFTGLTSQTEKIEKQIKENDEKTNERIDKLEQRTEKDITILANKLQGIEKDFPLVYVRQEEFFRSMNKVEDQMKEMNTKMDMLLTRMAAKPQ